MAHQFPLAAFEKGEGNGHILGSAALRVLGYQTSPFSRLQGTNIFSTIIANKATPAETTSSRPHAKTAISNTTIANATIDSTSATDESGARSHRRDHDHDHDEDLNPRSLNCHYCHSHHYHHHHNQPPTMPPIGVTAADPVNISLTVFSILAAAGYFTTLGYFAHRHQRTERALASLEAKVQEHTTTMTTEQERLNIVQADLRVRSCTLNNLGNRVTTLGDDVDNLNADLENLQEDLT